jgi:signal transduction histidine kinase
VSFAVLPLIVDGERMGVMVVNFKRNCDFGPTERLIHELFAQKAAMAVWSAQSREREQANLIRKERNALSRDMHDSVKQSLVTIRWQAYDLQQEYAANRVLAQGLAQIVDTAGAASTETTFMISELRAPDHELQHLICGLRAYVDRVQRCYTHFQVTFDHVGMEQLPEEISYKSLRFAREAINNAIRHSKGNQIHVCSEINDTELRLMVSDNGTGFDLCRVSPERIGLSAMRELAFEMRGHSWFEATPGGGTSVCLNVPLHQCPLGWSAASVPDWLHQKFNSGGVNPWTLI